MRKPADFNLGDSARIVSSYPVKAAHFLLTPELACSPPNEAIVSALLSLGYEVDLFAPGGPFSTTCYDSRVATHPVEYGKRWLLKNAWSSRWRKYGVISGTSEDPLAVAGVISCIHRRPFFALADEIKSGSYAGDAPESWKRLCRWAMRRAQFCVVNDVSRIRLQREYAHISPDRDILVYPACFRETPSPSDRGRLRKEWGIPEDALLLAASGGFNLTAGADWLVHAVQRDCSLYAAVQPLNLDPFSRFLLAHVQGHERIHVAERQLAWREAWASAAAFDIGMAVYRNPAPQFQNMGISSNRLCMFLAMGVPVIGNRQPSFKFIEDYDCGVLVDSREEFVAAVQIIRKRLREMKANALRCAREYIDAPARYEQLLRAIARLT